MMQTESAITTFHEEFLHSSKTTLFSQKNGLWTYLYMQAVFTMSLIVRHVAEAMCFA